MVEPGRFRSSRNARTFSDRDALRDEALADAPGEDERERARLHLLVLRHGIEQRIHVAETARHILRRVGRPTEAR